MHASFEEILDIECDKCMVTGVIKIHFQFAVPNNSMASTLLYWDPNRNPYTKISSSGCKLSRRNERVVLGSIPGRTQREGRP